VSRRRSRRARVIASTTVNASRIFPVFKERGALKIGAVADVTILDARRAVRVRRQLRHRRQGSQRLFPAGTVLAGTRAAEESEALPGAAFMYDTADEEES
jgi:predicted amidohydrolase YtcJ